MHESKSESEMAQSCPTLGDLIDGSPPVHGISSMGFSKQEYWSGLPFPSPGHLPNLGIKPRSPTLLADSLPLEPQEKATLPLYFQSYETMNSLIV